MIRPVGFFCEAQARGEWHLQKTSHKRCLERIIRMEQNAPPQPQAWPPGRVAMATLTVVAVAFAFFILFRFRLVFFSLFSAIVLSTAITPLVNRLSQLKIPRAVSVIFIWLLFVVLVVLFFVTIAPVIIDQWEALTSLISDTYGDLRQMMIESESLLIRRIAQQIPPALPLALPEPAPPAAGEENPADIVGQAFTLGSSVLRSLFMITCIGLLSGLWVLEGERFIMTILLAVPAGQRENIREFIREIEEKVGAYTRGLIVLCLIIGAMAVVSYLIIGLPNVLLLGIFAGVMEAVPLVGPLLGAIPALMVAVSTDPSKVIWVILATFLFQTLENNLIVPRVMNRAVGINPVASLLAFIAFGSIFGFVGALLAIPLAALIQITLNRFLFKPNSPESTPPGRRDRVSSLRYEAQELILDVRKQVREKSTALDQTSDRIEDTMEAVVQDLDSILAQLEIESNNGGSERAGGQAE